MADRREAEIIRTSEATEGPVRPFREEELPELQETDTEDEGRMRCVVCGADD